MILLPLISNRLLKLFGNIFKLIYELIHRINPKKRYQIPVFIPETKNNKKARKIPRIIWQTNFTNQVTLPLYINFLVNRFFSKGWEYRYFSHEARDEFIKENGTEKEYLAYSQLTVGASQADFWRIFVLNKIGGVYMDFEANLVWPIENILKDNPDYLFLRRDKYKDFTNYFIASAPNNKLLQDLLNDIVENILTDNPKNYGIYQLTGPGVFNRLLNLENTNTRNNRETCVQDTFSTVKYQYIDRPDSKWTNIKTASILEKTDKN